MKTSLRFTVWGLLWFLATLSQAAPQTIAEDTAADPAYDSWNAGDNGGTGFDVWAFQTGNSLGGEPNATAYVHSVVSNDQKTSASSGRAWALKANADGSFINVYRPFRAPIPAGGIVEVDFDNGVLTTGDTSVCVGNGLGGLVQFYGLAEHLTYYYRDFVKNDGELIDTDIPRTTRGVHLSFTQTTPGTYSLTIHVKDGKPITFTGKLKTEGWFNAIEFTAFNLGSGSAEDHDSFFNNLRITAPKPTPEN